MSKYLDNPRIYLLLWLLVLPLVFASVFDAGKGFLANGSAVAEPLKIAAIASRIDK